MAEETTLSAEEQKRFAVFNLNKLDYFIDPISGNSRADTEGKGMRSIFSNSLKVLLGEMKEEHYHYDVKYGGDISLKPDAIKTLAEAGVTQLAEVLGMNKSLIGGVKRNN